MNEALLIIKPLSIGRGDGPAILEDCLNKTNLCLLKFRAWKICSTTLDALAIPLDDMYPVPMTTPAWICVFGQCDTGAWPDYTLRGLWVLGDRSGMPLRKYKRDMHPSDTLVRITQNSRLEFEKDLLF